jgi:PAS domain-containing protein
MRHPGRAFSRTQLLEGIPGFQQHAPLDRAVDIHVSNLRRKVGEVMGDESIIETVRGVGYRLRAPVSESSIQPASMGGEQAQVALAAFEHVPLPLLVLTPDRTVVLYNEAARQLCGWSADQVVGQVKCYSLLGCHDEEGRLLCNRDCLLHKGALNQFREQTTHYCITLKDGREVPAVAHYTNLAEPGTKNAYILLALQPDAALPS